MGHDSRTVSQSLLPALDMVFIHTSSAFAPVVHSRPHIQTFSRTTPIHPQSSFHGRKLPSLRSHCPQHVPNSHTTPRMLVDPWSVSPATLDAVAAQLFAVSLFPYLTFLYYINRPSVQCPPLANFGFRFLLVFVFATIPAGIYAKVHYHDILANVDYLHGAAESLLTITNLLVVLGFRRALQASSTASSPAVVPTASKTTKLSVQLAPLAIALLAGLPLTLHSEPANALSFPTWIIHISSLVEWLVAMGLVWRYADTTNNSGWKGLTWGMLPLHTSGICACTYHLFYNAANLNSLVALQAFLTCVGNGTMAYAAYRLTGAEDKGEESVIGARNRGGLVGFEDLAELGDSDAVFLLKVFVISALGSACMKWGELLFDQPFHGDIVVALAIIFVPSAMNALKWAVRSRGDEQFGGLF